MNRPDETTCIRRVDWAAVYDAHADDHVYMRGVDIAFRGSEIIHVGPDYSGPADQTIDGSRLFLMPGLVCAHGHLGTEPLGKGFFEEIGTYNHWMTRLYEHIYSVRPPDARTRRAATRYAIAELLRSGATTVTDLSIPYEGWLDCCAKPGARVYVGAMFKSASWRTPDGNRIEYVWDVPGGEAGLSEALTIAIQARRHESGRLGAVLMPAQVDTCTPDLLLAACAAAQSLALPLHIHAGQSVPEFHEMVRRHGESPVAFLAKIGALSPRVTLSHAIFLDHHPWLHWHEARDLALLAEHGCGVVHCPTVFAYRGVMLHDFGTYCKAGVSMAIGADTFPHDMANEMRLALFAAKLARGHVDHTKVSDVFRAATLGGARALGRPDLGRIAPGALADLVMIDLSHPAMQPCRDPLRSFIFSAGSAAVRDVYVGGERVVADGRCLMMDLEGATAELRAGHAQAMDDVASRDWAGRDALTVSPLSLPPSRSFSGA